MAGSNIEVKHKPEEKGSGSGKAKRRSPNFPCIDLEKALELTEKIYSSDKRARIPVEILISRWNLPKYNSYVRQLIAALNYYGLIEISGKGEARRIAVSDRAYRILENAPDRGELIKEAALEPKLFYEVWNHYKKRGLPSEEVLERDLIWQTNFADAKFTKKGAKAFIANLKSTIAFTGISPEEPKYKEDHARSVVDVTVRENNSLSAKALRRLDMTLGSGEVVTIQIPTSITEKEIDFIQDGLRLIKGDLFPETKSENPQ